MIGFKLRGSSHDHNNNNSKIIAGERFYDDSVETREPLGRSSGIREISPDTLGYCYALQPLQLHLAPLQHKTWHTQGKVTACQTMDARRIPPSRSRRCGERAQTKKQRLLKATTPHSN